MLTKSTGWLITVYYVLLSLYIFFYFMISRFVVLSAYNVLTAIFAFNIISIILILGTEFLIRDRIKERDDDNENM